jgi:predicted metalloprotease with PDZ domain
VPSLRRATKNDNQEAPMQHLPRRRSLIALLFLAAAIAARAQAPVSDAAYPGTLGLVVDLRDTVHRVFRVRETVPANPGPLTLVYPKWVPGEHGPSGPLEGVTGLTISADGQALPWRRDLVDMYALHVEVPPGARAVEIAFQFLSPSGGAGGNFGAGASVTPTLAVLEWNQVVFYPGGTAANRVNVQPSIVLPPDWGWASALETAPAAGEQLRFQPATLETLVDSPLAAGRWFRRVELASDPVPVRLDLFADRPEQLAASEAQLHRLQRVVTEAQALFGARHYAHYDFLFVLSDLTDHFGLEHHQSSDDRYSADFFLDPASFLAGSSLLTHEYVHSWNGKFRRPAGLATANYQLPMKGDLLWVYEGQTEYWGEVLAARAGLRTPEQFRDDVATVASNMELTPGRAWRPLQDTADEAQVLYNSPRAWGNWRRGVDFYDEGLLLWLDVDTLIREKSHGERSLDDFVRLFHGRDDGALGPLPYGFDDVVAALDKVAHHDWAHFLRSRLEARGEVPLDGLRRAGWKLVYTEEPTEYFAALEKHGKSLNLAASLGVRIDTGEAPGTIADVIWNRAGFAAGLAPGMKVIAVNGTKFSPEVLKDAIRAAHAGPQPIDLLVQDADQYRTIRVDYHDGLRYPRLARIEGSEDLLGAISKAKAAP